MDKLPLLLKTLRKVMEQDPQLLHILEKDMEHLNTEQTIEFLEALLNHSSPYKNVEMTPI